VTNPVGIFDPELLQTEWFDVTNVVQGWFDADLVYVGTAVVIKTVPEDLFDFFNQDQAYAAEDSDTTELIISSTPSLVNPVQVYIKDVIIPDWWEDVDDPTIIDAEWSGPVQPRPPPQPIEHDWDWHEESDEIVEWLIDAVAIPNPPAPSLNEQWDWYEEIDDDWDDPQIAVQPLQPALPLNEQWDWYEEIDDAWEAFIDPKQPWILDGLFKGQAYQLSVGNTGGTFTQATYLRSVVAQVIVTGPGGGGALNTTLYATGGSGASTVLAYVTLSGLGNESFYGTIPPGGLGATTYPGNGQDGGAGVNTLLNYIDASSTTYAPLMIGRHGFGGQAGATPAPPAGAVTVPADIYTSAVLSPNYYSGKAGNLSSGGIVVVTWPPVTNPGYADGTPLSGVETVPVNATRVTIEAYGTGASGSSNVSGGGGGGGGGYARLRSITVVPGDQFSVSTQWGITPAAAIGSIGFNGTDGVVDGTGFATNSAGALSVNMIAGGGATSPDGISGGAGGTASGGSSSSSTNNGLAGSAGTLSPLTGGAGGDGASLAGDGTGGNGGATLTDPNAPGNPGTAPAGGGSGGVNDISGSGAPGPLTVPTGSTVGVNANIIFSYSVSTGILGGGGGGSGYWNDTAGATDERPDRSYAVRTRNQGDANGPGGGGAGIIDSTSTILQAGVGGDGAVVIVLWYDIPINTFVIYEDAWNWFGDNDDAEDNWEAYGIDNNVTQMVQNAVLNKNYIIEDAWNWKNDTDTEDNWEAYGIDNNVTQMVQNAVLNKNYIIEDAWNWNGDGDDSEDFWMEENAPPIRNNIVLGPDESWDWLTDGDDSEDFWWIDEVALTPQLNLIEDAWNWEETDEEDFWQEEQQPVGASPPPPVEDAWDWNGDGDDSEDFWTDESAPPISNVRAFLIEDAWNWDEVDEEDLWWVDELIITPLLNLIEDPWNWDESEEEDFWQEEQQPVGPNAALAIDDAWDWNSDGDNSEDFWMEEQSTVPPNYAPAAPLGFPDDWYWDEEVVEDDWYWCDADAIVSPIAIAVADTLCVNPPAQTTTIATIGTVDVAIVSNTGIVVTGLTAYARISQVNVWGDIDDQQDPNWVPVDENTPTPTPPNWMPVDETSPTPPTWVPVDETSPTLPTWSPVDTTSPAPNWKLTKD